jgi:CubicO group peptidase (beta-lactamase class C family)
MRLYEQGKIDLNKTLGDYLPITKGSNKEYCLVKDLLMHQAGMKSWIPFYKFFKDSSAAFKDGIFNNYKTKTYAIEVAKDVFMNATYRDTIWKMILESPLENKGKMVYSDLDFIFMQAVVEFITKKKLDEFVRDEFYKPLGMNYTCFVPKKNLKNAEIDNFITLFKDYKKVKN